LDFSRRTNEANAAVIGFGRSRRVVLADTLLDSFPALEIRAVVAHELGHHVHRDVLWLLVIQGAVMLVGLALAATVGDPLLQLLGAGAISDPVNFPLLVAAASLFGLLTLPPVNAISRAVEARADTYSFRLLGDGRPFAAAMRRLADQNLAEERPPLWAELLLYTHPPIWRRVERAEAAHHA
jgi:STE24 endopeptidase